PLLGAEPQLAVAHEIDTPFEAVPIDDDLDQVPIQNLPDRPSRERLGPDVADARTGRHAGEAGVGQHRHLLAPRQVLQRRGDLLDLFHARAERAAADEDHDVARLDPARPLALDGGDRRALPREHARRTDLAVHTVGTDDRRVDGRALDHGPLRGQVPPGERYRA